MVATSKQSTSRLEDARARMYRDLIFESAECVFGARGFEGATMQEIANEAGVSLKTVYASYPGKRELFDAIMRERGAAFHDHVREAVENTHGGTLEQLEAMTGAFVEFLFAHREWLQIHMRSRIAWSVRPSEEAAADLWRRGLEDFEKLLGEGIEQGLFYPTDPSELAVLVNTITKVLVTYAAEAGEDDPQPVAERATLYLRRLLCVPGAAERASG
jgi:TetR/AcrR family transcriptional regulator